MINVKVIRVPGTVQDVALNNGATVQDALNEASISIGEGEKMQLNGLDTHSGASLNDGDRIIVAKGAKGA